MNNAHKTISIKNVIAKVFQTVKPEPAWADDMLIWLPEGCDDISIRYNQVKSYCVKTVRNHICNLPTGLTELKGIIYNNKRLSYNPSSVDPRVLKDVDLDSDLTDLFKTDVTDELHINGADYDLIRGLDLKQSTTLGTSSEWYSTQPNYIHTSFEEGEIIFIYHSRPIDEEGYPLIPDYQSVREALMWWCLSRMFLAGFKHVDTSLNYQSCMSNYRLYRKKAHRDLGRLSDDQKQYQINASVHMIPPRNYHDDFFLGSSSQQQIDTNPAI